jgi:hypothetical protein
MVAKGPFANNKGRQNNEQKKNEIVGDKTLDIPDGKAVCCLIEEIYTIVSSCFDRENCN